MTTRDDVIAISNAAADRAGIPRLLLLACGIAESGLRSNARRPTDPADDERYWTDVSHGVWQQTVRWSGEYAAWCAEVGHPPAEFPGADVTEAAGLHYYDVAHAAEVAAAQLRGKYHPSEPDAVFRALCRYNFPGGNGQPSGPAQEENYRRGIREALAILGTPAPTADAPSYDPSTPAEIQVNPFTCSIRATRWVLASLGVVVPVDELHDRMVPALVSPKDGLLNARGYGSGIEEVLREYLPPAWYSRIVRLDTVTWDHLWQLAGTGPIAAGGRAWGHWAAISGRTDDGALVVRNPARNGWMGVTDRLTPSDFARLGSFGIVYVAADPVVAEPGPTDTPTSPLPSEPVPPAVPDTPPTPEETIDGLRVAVAHLADVVVPAAAAGDPGAVAEARRIRDEFLGSGTAA